MIVYQATKAEFIRAVRADVLADHVNQSVLEKLNKKTSESEYRSWRNSSVFMRSVFEFSAIPSDCTIAIEYQLPTTSKRIDFLISGYTDTDSEALVIVELKQWDKAEVTNMDAIVRTYIGGGIRDVSHPSYQAWTYADTFNNFSERAYEENVGIHACAFLHNFPVDDDTLHDERYRQHIERAPIFRKSEAEQLANFISSHVSKSDNGKILYEIDEGRIRPSKMLADSLASMLKGNNEFLLLDEQKLVYEKILLALKVSNNTDQPEKKKVFIIEGGPGTGKSVVAINLLVEVTKRRGTVHYATRNSAPREVYAAKLTGTMNKTAAKNLFRGTGSYINAENNDLDVLIVDEAHRLNAKSGMFAKGENQIKEIINAAKISVFFVDPHQKVTLKDIGDIEEIERWANEFKADTERLSLPSQFRCGGSDGYLSWIDQLLNIRETAVTSLENLNYDFRVFDSPEEMRREIVKHNDNGEMSRMLTGYCWPWKSKKEPSYVDVTIPEHEFGMQWNDFNLGQGWIMHDQSVEQIGCIHTSQGLEVSYAGVIIGQDLRLVDGVLTTDPSKHPGQDSALQGYKKLIKDNPIEGQKLVDQVIRNTYRVLLTRGMKGCFVYCCDADLQSHLKRSAWNQSHQLTDLY